MKKQVILGLETCTTVCSVALWNGERLFERVEQEASSQSKTILPMVESVLAEAQLTLSQVDAVACTRGPGSFTGVRIGIGVAKGLAYGQDLPIYPVSPLQSLAYQVIVDMPSVSRVSILLDARMGELYTADYQNTSGKPVLLGQERLATLDDISIEGQIVAGTGAREYSDALVERGARLSGIIYPLAGAVIRCAQLTDIEAVSAAQLTPVYLRNKVTG
ncbi:MAG: tRNA (adenosine(37)-N6)-threonylcarbamoyltransferase complex dimerization subunit type 1 TsaB [Gammaproteobacteria bacterium]|nr:MAG: tRNA (adenosine(37)-N6)-threonylcarbamoyltransferase complex dimerization subunit type 1 TsaB [Gammaproteobacteria bacterium]